MIEDLTASCPRDDCSIQAGAGVMALVGWTQTYDRAGFMLGSDPNKTTRHPHCTRCGRSWTVTMQAGQPGLITEHPQRT